MYRKCAHALLLHTDYTSDEGSRESTDDTQVRGDKGEKDAKGMRGDEEDGEERNDKGEEDPKGTRGDEMEKNDKAGRQQGGESC